MQCQLGPKTQTKRPKYKPTHVLQSPRSAVRDRHPASGPCHPWAVVTHLQPGVQVVTGLFLELWPASSACLQSGTWAGGRRLGQPLSKVCSPTTLPPCLSLHPALGPPPVTCQSAPSGEQGKSPPVPTTPGRWSPRPGWEQARPGGRISTQGPGGGGGSVGEGHRDNDPPK